MPNGAISALESQQRIGAQIPYENIAANQRGMQLFMNAIQQGVNLNRQRLQMEQAMSRLQMENERINLARDALETRTEHMGFLETMAERNNQYKDAMLGLKEFAIESKAKSKTDDINNLNDLNHALFGITSERGSAAHLIDLNKIHYDFGSTISTPAGQRLWQNAISEYTKASTEKQKAASNIFKTGEEARKMAGNVSWYDLAQPDEVWGHVDSAPGYPQGKSFLAHDARTGIVIPSDKIEEFKKTHGELDENKKPTISWSSVHTPDLQRARGMRDAISKIVGGTLDDKPGAFLPPEQRITVTKPDGTVGTIPASQKDAAVAAGYTLNQ